MLMKVLKSGWVFPRNKIYLFIICYNFHGLWKASFLLQVVFNLQHVVVTCPAFVLFRYGHLLCTSFSSFSSLVLQQIPLKVQTYKQTNIQTDKQTNKQTTRQTDKSPLKVQTDQKKTICDRLSGILQEIFLKYFYFLNCWPNFRLGRS